MKKVDKVNVELGEGHKPEGKPYCEEKIVPLAGAIDGAGGDRLPVPIKKEERHARKTELRQEICNVFIGVRVPILRPHGRRKNGDGDEG